MQATSTSRGFGGDLVAAVDERLDDHTMRTAYRQLHRKAVIVSIWYVASLVGVCVARGWWWGTLTCTSLAFAFAAVGFNIQHDANHNAFFPTGGTKRLTRANRIVGWSMFAIGADANRWIYRHGTLHHGSPNVDGVDTDIHLGPLARFAPSQRWYWWHRYQHVYLWPLYCFTALEIMVNDITALIGEARHPSRTRPRPRVGDYLLVVGTKVVAFAVLLGVPSLFHPWWVVAVGGAGVLLGTGFLLGMVFQAAHVVTEAEWATAEDRGGFKFHEWQVRSSLDFSHGTGPLSRALRWFVGGLDHQTEHHLFPRLPHTAYPVLAPLVTDLCATYDIPRFVQPSFRAAIASHARHLRAMSLPPAYAAREVIAARRS